MEELKLGPEYIVQNMSSNQGFRTKYYVPSSGAWYKADPNYTEVEVSNLLRYSSVLDYVDYNGVRVNGKNYCKSTSFKLGGTTEITFDRIVKYVTGLSAIDYLYRFYEPLQRYNELIKVVGKYSGIHVGLYVKTMLYLDMLIANPDRHFNNMALLGPKYRTAPIFDNGAAFDEDRRNDCGNIGGTHEYVISSLGKCNSPIRIDYDRYNPTNKIIKENLLKYESIFRYKGKIYIKEYGRLLKLLPEALIERVDGEGVDYVSLVEEHNENKK